MKYNGQEVGLDFAQRIQNEFNARGGEFLSLKEVSVMLEVCEEVWQETQPEPKEVFLLWENVMWPDGAVRSELRSVHDTQESAYAAQKQGKSYLIELTQVKEN